jgi:hypothetical protein
MFFFFNQYYHFLISLMIWTFINFELFCNVLLGSVFSEICLTSYLWFFPLDDFLFLFFAGLCWLKINLSLPLSPTFLPPTTLFLPLLPSLSSFLSRVVFCTAPPPTPAANCSYHQHLFRVRNIQFCLLSSHKSGSSSKNLWTLYYSLHHPCHDCLS